MAKSSGRFGMRLNGINLLLQRGQPAEYLSDITVYPIPLMPQRVRGAAQVAGAPVLVFAADEQAPDRLPVLARKSIVMLTVRGAALALQVESPPIALDALAPSDEARPALCFEPALIAAYRGRDTASGSLHDNELIWWEVDCAVLFERLARDGRAIDPAARLAAVNA